MTMSASSTSASNVITLKGKRKRKEGSPLKDAFAEGTAYDANSKWYLFLFFVTIFTPHDIKIGNCMHEKKTTKKTQSHTHTICLRSKQRGIFISSQLTLLRSSPPCCSPGLPALRPALALWRRPLLPGRVLADRCACCRSGEVWVEVVEGACPAPLPPLSVHPDKLKTIPDVFH